MGKEWKSVQIDKEAHDLIKKWHEATLIQIRELVSVAVKDAIYCKENHLGMEVFDSDEGVQLQDRQCVEGTNSKGNS